MQPQKKARQLVSAQVVMAKLVFLKQMKRHWQNTLPLRIGFGMRSSGSILPGAHTLFLHTTVLGIRAGCISTLAKMRGRVVSGTS